MANGPKSTPYRTRGAVVEDAPPKVVIVHRPDTEPEEGHASPPKKPPPKFTREELRAVAELHEVRYPRWAMWGGIALLVAVLPVSFLLPGSPAKVAAVAGAVIVLVYRLSRLAAR